MYSFFSPLPWARGMPGFGFGFGFVLCVVYMVAVNNELGRVMTLYEMRGGGRKERGAGGTGLIFSSFIAAARAPTPGTFFFHTCRLPVRLGYVS